MNKMNQDDTVLVPENGNAEQPNNKQQETQENLVANLNQKINELTAELKKELERSGYLAADMDTLRRRSEKECRQLVDSARVKILSDLLRIADDFDRAFVEVKRKPELLSYLAGFELTAKNLQSILATHGVTPIEISASQIFDPNFHEAIMRVDVPEKQSGEIVAVLQKGYLLNGVLLRPAKVSVKV